MIGLLNAITASGPVLLAVAAPAEARAVLAGLKGPPAAADRPWEPVRVSDRFEVVVTGVGKANAAGAVGRCVRPGRHAAVISVGVAGSLGAGGPAIGAVVVATRCVYADEGMVSERGFVDIGTMGFAPAPGAEGGFTVDAALVAALRPIAGAQGVIATVSTCSGTGAGAAEVVRRTGAIAECMEGAAVANAAARMGVRFGELRVISNTTGDRAGQVWDLAGALRRLSDVMAAL